jgi:hypothetical protein
MSKELEEYQEDLLAELKEECEKCEANSKHCNFDPKEFYSCVGDKLFVKLYEIRNRAEKAERIALLMQEKYELTDRDVEELFEGETRDDKIKRLEQALKDISEEIRILRARSLYMKNKVDSLKDTAYNTMQKLNIRLEDKDTRHNKDIIESAFTAHNYYYNELKEIIKSKLPKESIGEEVKGG